MNKINVVVALSLSVLMTACSGQSKVTTEQTSEVISAQDSLATEETGFSTDIEFMDPTIMVTVDTTNVRKQPSKDSDVIELLGSGEEVTVIGKTKDGWYLLEDGKSFINEEAFADDQNAEEDPPSDCMTIDNTDLHCSFSMSNYYGNMLKSEAVATGKDSDLDADKTSILYYVEFNGVKQPVFTINCVQKVIAADELENLNPLMVYLSGNDSVTYTMQYAEDPVEGLSEEDIQTYYDMMNTDAAQIPGTFTVSE